MNKVYWCGFEVPDDISATDCTPGWPHNMQAWCTGSGGYTHSYATWTAMVYAPDARQAEALIRSAYTVSGHLIRMRWEPEEKPSGWRPGDRFPDKDEK